MLAHKAGGEAGPCGEVSLLDCSDPGRRDWTPAGGMQALDELRES